MVNTVFTTCSWWTVIHCSSWTQVEKRERRGERGERKAEEMREREEREGEREENKREERKGEKGEERDRSYMWKLRQKYSQCPEINRFLNFVIYNTCFFCWRVCKSHVMMRMHLVGRFFVIWASFDVLILPDEMLFCYFLYYYTFL